MYIHSFTNNFCVYTRARATATLATYERRDVTLYTGCPEVKSKIFVNG